jgi:site-specific DNA-methyltransferase (adenine-specific)
MTVQEMRNLPIADIAAKDCVLFFWATYPMLKNALDIIESWGFKYRTSAFTWVKHYSTSSNICTGLGYWTRSNAELCLLGIKGRPKRLSTAVKEIVMAPRGRHSAKPPEIRDRIVQLMGDLPRIELFARERTPGWHSLGLDLDGMDIRKSLYMINVCNQINR